MTRLFRHLHPLCAMACSRCLFASAAVSRPTRAAFGIASATSHARRATFYSPSISTSIIFPQRTILTTSFASSSSTCQKAEDTVPMTLLSGFLGSGKTTALKNLLENREGVRVGVIVNDVASVNIDARLISNQGSGETASDNVIAELGGTIELQNGCACCTLADELLTSVQQLMDGRELDAVVVELSGVADPVSVKRNWEQAKVMEHPATKLASVDRVVTVVDACTFGTDWMTWDRAGERDRWVEEGDDCTAAERNVPELLAEQVEAADLLLINKIDLAGKEQVAIASGVARGLNDKANVFEVEYGKVSPKEILGGGVMLDVEEEDHSHDHDHACANPDCTDPDCGDSAHDRSHSHDHASKASCGDPDCTDQTHSHSHSHENDAEKCTDPDCSDPDCSDPDCNDSSHDHTASSNTSTDKLGISSFVYRASVPFDARRLLGLLNQWPVPIKDVLDIDQMQRAQKEGYQTDNGLDSGSPFLGVLRSKGFCWMAPTKWTGGGDDAWRHDTAMFWSHAGKHFGITTAGKWWGTISNERMKSYFATNMGEYERILRDDWASEEWGDRRQELVFIGTGLDEGRITEALNACLCTEEEMDDYRQQLRNSIDTTFMAEVVEGPA